MGNLLNVESVAIEDYGYVDVPMPLRNISWSQSWVASGTGIYYYLVSLSDYVTDAIPLSVTIKGFGSIRNNNQILPMISGDATKVGLMSNTNSFDTSADTSIRVFYKKIS